MAPGVRLAAVAAHLSPPAAAATAAAATPSAPSVGLLGLPSDGNSTYLRGPAGAPAALRAALACDSANGFAELGDSFTEIVVDHGGRPHLVSSQEFKRAI